MKSARRRAGGHGSVTVILTLVLVPVLAITGAFVDGSRAELSRTVVRSAEQLALNDVLASHEAKLMKTLGLLAVIDSEDLDVAAHGILQGSLTPGDGDILQIGLKSPAAGTVKPVAGSSLGEREVLLNQMVEFMKYRAPASFLGDLADSIAWLKDFKKKLDLIEKMTKAVDKARVVFEEATELVKAVETLIARLDELEKAIARFEKLTSETSSDSIERRVRDVVDLIAEDVADPGSVSTARWNAAEQRLGEVWTVISGTASAAVRTSDAIRALNPRELQDAINDFSGVYTEAQAAIDALGGDKGDTDTKESSATLAALKDKIAKLQGLLDKLKINALINKVPGDTRETLDSILDEFAAKVEHDLEKKFSKISEIRKLIKAFDGTGEVTPLTPESAAEEVTLYWEKAVAYVIAEIWPIIIDPLIILVAQATGELIRVAAKKVYDSLSEQLTDLIDLIKPDEAAKAAGSAAFGRLVDKMKKAVGDYRTLITKLANQKVSPYVEGGDPLWTDRPSASGGTGDDDKVAEVLETAESTDEDSVGEDSANVFRLIGDLIGMMSDSLELVRDGVFFMEYTTGLFTYSTREKEEPEGKRASQEPLPSCWKDECAAEVEYVLTGATTPAGAYGIIFLLRLGINAIVAWRDPVVSFIRTAVGAIPVVGGLLMVAVPFIAALLQAATDLAELAAGKKVELWPKKIEVLSVREGVTGIIEDVLPGAGDSGAGGDKEGLDKKGPELSYIDHIKLMMFLQWFAPAGRDAMIDRAGDVVQLIMGLEGQKDFRLNKAYTAYTVTAEYDVDPLVGALVDFTDPGDLLLAGDKGKHRLTTVGGF